MSVAGEMEVDIFHRADLGTSASCSSSLDSKDGAQRRLSQSDSRPKCQATQPHAQPDRGSRFSFSKGSRIDGGDQNIPSERSVCEPLLQTKSDLRLITTEWDQVLRMNA